MSAPRKATGGKSKPKLTKIPAECPPRGRSAAKPSSKIPAPPQGHSGFKRRVERKPPRASSPPRYETTNSKDRIISSAVETAEERGYESLRITDITDPLGIQRQAFYAHFKDKRHCLCAAMDPKLGAIVELAASSDQDPPRWAELVVDAIDEALRERFHSPEGTRARLVSAMIEMLRESESFDAIRIGKLVRRAHVPTGDFYRQFAGKRECFAVAYGVLLEELLAEVRSAKGRTSTPELLDALGSALSADPTRLRLLVVEAAHLPDLPTEDLAGAWRGSLASSLVDLLGECEGVDGDDLRLPLISGSLIEAIRSTVVAGNVDGIARQLVSLGRGLGLAESAAALAPAAAA